ncbi:hypothetical protein EV127DRAFT_468877 [Xylaria flabelliformis]|nr:hypothetical protein EV127DRAFT_468877 [Xylaria flabelliformis]
MTLVAVKHCSFVLKSTLDHSVGVENNRSLTTMKAMREPIPQAPMRKVMKPAMVTKRKKLCRQRMRPAIGSLYDIMDNHAGAGLFARPLFWTDLHTKLLNCRFVQLPPHLTPIPTPPSSQRPRKVSRTIVSIGRELDTLMATDKPIIKANILLKYQAISAVLSTLYPECFSAPSYPGLGILFGPRCYQGVVGNPLLWHHINPDANPTSFDSSTTLTGSQPVSREASYSTASVNAVTDSPLILAYISRRHIDHQRKNCMSVTKRSNGEPNEPVLRLQAHRSKKVTPKNANEDPYYFGIMVAIAQKCVYTDLSAATNFKPRDVKVRLLVASEADNAFIVYTGIVPGALLSMFHEPDTAPTSNTEVKIEHARVPIWPVMGLKERLGKALGSDLVGHYDDSTIDTFRETVTRAPKASSKKREREALSEVTNGTFCEDYRHQTNNPPGPKKRCVGVGLVR